VVKDALLSIAVNTFFEERLQDLFSLADLVEQIFLSAGLEYRIVGGLATYLYVEEAEPDAGRLTKDIDLIVRREDLKAIARAAESFGYEYRRAAGNDMLVRVDQPSGRRAVHLVFAGEKVRPEYPEPAPALGDARRIRGLRVIPLPDLVRTKLTSFRIRDQVHLKDLEEAGLITRDVEGTLPGVLMERLADLRTRD
jgi:hypothetical protein